jgi:hypothetical protein
VDDIPDLPPAIDLPGAQAKPRIEATAGRSSDTPGAAASNTNAAAVSPSATSDEEIIAMISQELRQAWRDNGVTPSTPAADAEWCRRVFLDIIGRTPSLEEVSAFVADRASDKKAKLVDRLLSDEYLDEYARNWTTIWTNVLIGRNGGLTDNTLIAALAAAQQAL